jgi:hypothetical protein
MNDKRAATAEPKPLTLWQGFFLAEDENSVTFQHLVEHGCVLSTILGRFISREKMMRFAARIRSPPSLGEPTRKSTANLQHV